MVSKDFFITGWWRQGLLGLTILTAVLPYNHSGLTEPEPWMQPFNEAVSRRMVIGEEIVFTFGPYAGVYTESYHPTIWVLIMAASILLAAGVSLAAYWLSKGLSVKVYLGLIVLFAGLIFSREGLLASVPLIIGLLGFLVGQNRAPRLTMLAFSLLGLLPLIKGSYLLISVGVTLLTSWWLLVCGKRVLALAVLVIVGLSNLGFWILSGQQLTNLPAYYQSMLPMISGFTGAMALYSRSWEVGLYILVSAGVLLYLIRAKLPAKSRMYLWLLLGLHLFSQFKAGFVRHDGHALNATTGLFIGASLLALVLRQRQFTRVLLASLLAALLISEKHLPSLLLAIPENIISTYRITKPNSTEPARVLPRLPGTSDVYSVDQDALLAASNQWNPRPVFQSYSAYTPELLELNRQHLLQNPPDNIFFRVEPIDGRLPALEEGASWPVMLANYSYRSTSETHLILSRNNQEVSEPKLLPVAKQKAQLGAMVSLPQADGFVFAKLVIEPTQIGKIISLGYKPQELRIVLTLTDGRQVNYRMIPAMAESGFVLSPLVEDSGDFGALFTNSNSKQVVSFQILPAASYDYSWKTDYRVEFFKILD